MKNSVFFLSVVMLLSVNVHAMAEEDFPKVDEEGVNFSGQLKEIAENVRRTAGKQSSASTEVGTPANTTASTSVLTEPTVAPTVVEQAAKVVEKIEESSVSTDVVKDAADTELPPAPEATQPPVVNGSEGEGTVLGSEVPGSDDVPAGDLPKDPTPELTEGTEEVVQSSYWSSFKNSSMVEFMTENRPFKIVAISGSAAVLTAFAVKLSGKKISKKKAASYAGLAAFVASTAYYYGPDAYECVAGYVSGS